MREALADDYPDIALDSLRFDELDPIADTIDYGVHFRARQAVKTAGTTRIFSLYIPDRMASEEIPVDEPYPEGMDLSGMSYSLDTYLETATVAFPANWKLLSLPTPVTLKTEFGDYSMSVKVKGNTLTLVRKADFKLGKPVTAANTAKARAFLTGIAKADDLQLVFTQRK